MECVTPINSNFISCRMAANSWVMNAATVGLGFAGFYALREYMRGGQCTSDVRMDGKGRRKFNLDLLNASKEVVQF